MSIVAPISATGAAVPVLVGARRRASGPGALQIAGIAARAGRRDPRLARGEPAGRAPSSGAGARRDRPGARGGAGLRDVLRRRRPRLGRPSSVPWALRRRALDARSCCVRHRRARRARPALPRDAAQLRRARDHRRARPRRQRALRARDDRGAAVGRRRPRLALPGRSRCCWPGSSWASASRRVQEVGDRAWRCAGRGRRSAQADAEELLELRDRRRRRRGGAPSPSRARAPA